MLTLTRPYVGLDGSFRHVIIQLHFGEFWRPRPGLPAWERWTANWFATNGVGGTFVLADPSAPPYEGGTELAAAREPATWAVILAGLGATIARVCAATCRRG